VTALAGFWATGFGGEPLAAVDRMLKALAPYGPGSPARRAEGPVAIGRRLFPLLPEDRFDAGPVTGGGGRWMLVADLRLDDRDGISDSLGIPAGEAARLSDAALLMRMWERWELETLDRLVGDFAFAVWDRSRERLVLARDPFGHRPLHFHRQGGFFAFASMAKGLHALAEVPHGPDEHVLRAFLALLPEPPTATFFQGIERVPPGHLAIVSRSGQEIRRYWTPGEDPLRLGRAEDYDEAIRDALDRAVAARLRGAGPAVASHLSGGLDSSAVTATAARLLAGKGRIRAFTSAPREGFDDPVQFGRFADESRHAAAVAALYPNIDHELIRTGGRSPFERLERDSFLYERPVLNLCNMVWVDAINAAARSHGLSVVLTAHLGNLSFSYNGFEHLSGLLRRGRLLDLGRTAFGLRRQGVRWLSVAAHCVGPFLPSSTWKQVNALAGRGLLLSDYSAIAADAGARALGEGAAAGHDWSYRPSGNSRETRMRALAGRDPGNFYKGMLAGYGTDQRDATADRRLVELCLSIPDDQYLRGGRMRALARDAFADRLPPEILNESRKGLQAADWYEGLTAARSDAAEEVERLDALPAAHRLLDVERMRRLLGDMPQGGWQSHKTQRLYRLALLRGISAGHFLRKSLGAN